MIDFHDREEITNKLKELKAKNLPHMTIEQFSELNTSFKDDIKSATEDEKKVISKNLFRFYHSNKGNKCIFTDVYPSLTWGLHHGTLIDSDTGLSWEGYHYYIINKKEHRYEIALQYHPDNYEIDEEEI